MANEFGVYKRNNMSAKAINLNMLFIDLLPSYGFVLNSLNEKQIITKQEFIELFSKTFNVMEPRTNLMLHAIKDSKFETIRKENGSAMFE